MDKAFSWLLGAIFVTLPIGCASVTVQTDYDRSQRFSAYKRYAWAPRPERELPGTQPLSPADVIRARKAVDARLSAKGFTQGERGGADFLVAIHTGVREREEISRAGQDRLRSQRQETRTREYVDLTIVLDVVDSSSGKLVWQGIAKGSRERPQDAGRAVEEAVERLLAAFPPR